MHDEHELRSAHTVDSHAPVFALPLPLPLAGIRRNPASHEVHAPEPAEVQVVQFAAQAAHDTDSWKVPAEATGGDDGEDGEEDGAAATARYTVGASKAAVSASLKLIVSAIAPSV